MRLWRVFWIYSPVYRPTVANLRFIACSACQLHIIYEQPEICFTASSSPGAWSPAITRGCTTLSVKQCSVWQSLIKAKASPHSLLDQKNEIGKVWPQLAIPYEIISGNLSLLISQVPSISISLLATNRCAYLMREGWVNQIWTSCLLLIWPLLILFLNSTKCADKSFLIESSNKRFNSTDCLRINPSVAQTIVVLLLGDAEA